MLQSMTDTQSKHLKAWAKAVKNIGKNTGKNAPNDIEHNAPKTYGTMY